ncbi:MAG: inositol monophosphatase family protein [Verrucomicrobiaceae bacterium]|nr:inositol monophosphatase family protein [Verrucomicrobiaceae bacterium]
MDTDNFKIFINELADISGEYIAKSFGKNVGVDFKCDNSPVTEIDRNTELLLRERIQQKFPTHGIIGEEFGNVNENAEFVWVLDPIDGTKSFITKVPLFGTLIGLQYCGKPIVGVIDQPILKERIVGDCKTCTFNGKQVRTSQRTSVDGMTLLTSDSRYCADLHGHKAWKELENSAAISRTWGDCYGYMLLCRGLAHVMCDALLEVWDFTALLPALAGAGASFSDWNGGNNIGHDGGLIASCTPELHKQVLDIIKINQNL